ncbi:MULTISPECIES: hypothetical protein [Sphingobacterium]|uniref:hypothetical protein n=1 Tax=Sphingobacterium TaxID=28453 RepID=UPI00258045D8|nr:MULTISPECIES: hypothetical protein [Sphingobacterium]
MKYVLLFLLTAIVSCSDRQKMKLDIYFNSASLITKDFNIKIETNKEVVFDTTLYRTEVATYRKIGNIEIKNKENCRVIVNGLDSIINIDNKYHKLFIGYKEEFFFRERTDRPPTSDEEKLTYDKKYHKLVLKLKK